MIKVLEMLAIKRQRELLIEFNLIRLCFSKRLIIAIKSSENEVERAFFNLVSQLELDSRNASVFVFNSTVIRMNTFEVQEPILDDSKPIPPSCHIFNFELFEEFGEQILNDKDLEYIFEGVIVEEI